MISLYFFVQQTYYISSCVLSFSFLFLPPLRALGVLSMLEERKAPQRINERWEDR
jgi:hypothetical protein